MFTSQNRIHVVEVLRSPGVKVFRLRPGPVPPNNLLLRLRRHFPRFDKKTPISLHSKATPT